MALKAEQAKAELVEAVAQRVRDRLPKPKSDLTERFVRQFYANVPPDDIHRRSADQLYAAALSLWQFAGMRAPGQAKVRLYNPQPDEHGWRAGHTIVEIVNDDMPFLVDSVTAELNRHELMVHLVIHPVARVARDADGRVAAFAEGVGEGSPESFMHIEIDEIVDPKALDHLRVDLEHVLSDVRAAVADWAEMRDAAEKIIECRAPALVPDAEREEANAFLRWLNDDHFTFLGYREYRFEGDGDDSVLKPVSGSGLGILRDDSVSVFDGLRNVAVLPEVRQFLRQPRLLMVSKANRRATVHRAVHMDTIGFKIFDDKGEVIGEKLFLGLFTSTAYARSARDIPFLRRKTRHVLERAGFAPKSHDGKALTHILDTYPRDELFQIDEGTLFDISLGILHLQDRQRVALFVRRDPFERFASCMVYVPRDRFDTELRRRAGEILADAWGGAIRSFYTQLDDSPLARVHFIIDTAPGQTPTVDVEEIEARLAEAARSWSDKLRQTLIEARGEAQGINLHRRYGDAFPTAYRELTGVGPALYDIERVDRALKERRLVVSLYRTVEAADFELRFKLYHQGSPVILSDVLPMLESMGLRVISETPFEARPAGGGSVWIHDFHLETRRRAPVDLSKVRDDFHDAFLRIWNGDMENDGFNRLVLGAGLDWRAVTALRGYAKYLRQARFQFSQDTIEETFSTHPKIAAAIFRLFEASFDPARPRDKADSDRLAALQEIERALDAVANLDEDRILRRFVNLIDATLRTNFHRRDADGNPLPYLSFKLDSQRIEDLPLPRPMVEVFVYSPRMEGIHLRGGKVARGGIRWSDRREDFRTEILGLMKAQMVKNAVIVPVGSKGGFIVKRPPAEGGREALMAEVVACYKMLIRGMLDITDNVVGGEIAPPPDVARRDGDDPYLVVAADKGTATFSDIANGVSLEYGFWLGDAFASGGSAGYDHKKMGITARGAWESVKRHFRELGRDIQREDFTAVGVGDMSGDVFGNGMLLSKHIRLVAAFNHMHIFLDPEPDAAVGWEERKRLFDLPRSAWTDYDAAKISAGGGVFERSAKSIPLSPQVKARFGIEEDRLTPAELIQRLLTAPVDLLWFGGIGTYVKASGETHADAGDKTNDALRVDAADLRALAVGEGANLGVTQKGRIEYALKGGRINTDAIDNSAGVDTSDHEVNIKILFGDVMQRGDLTLKQRDAMLAEMTDEVARLVLNDNYLQTQALSVEETYGPAHLDRHIRLMQALERRGLLNRRIEYLPDDAELARRRAAGRGLTRPELAVLLAYSKIAHYDDVLPTELPDAPRLQEELARYFPKPLQAKFADAISRHMLRREIAATHVVNAMVNRVGPGFVREMTDKTGMGPADVSRAYEVARDAFKLDALWAEIEALDNVAPAEAQLRMLMATQRLLERAVPWFLTHGSQPIDMEALAAVYGPGVDSLTACLEDVLGADDKARWAAEEASLAAAGAPPVLARRVASLDYLAAATDVARIAAATGGELKTAAAAYFAIGERLGLDWMRAAAATAPRDTPWQQLAIAALRDDLDSLQGELTGLVLADRSGSVDGWLAAREGAIARFERLLIELKAAPATDAAMLTVAVRQLRGLAAG